jgi:kynureninase
MIDLDRCRRLDADDQLARFRDRFAAPEAKTIFLDANSVGAMPKDVPARAERLWQLWVEHRRRGWTISDWLEKPRLLGASIGHLIGARPDDVIVTDNTSINLFKLLSLALRLRPERRVVLTEPGNFPTDLFIAQGLARWLGDGVEVRAIDDRDALLEAIGADTAVVYLSHVDYRTSWRWDMAEVCRRARGRCFYPLGRLARSRRDRCRSGRLGRRPRRRLHLQVSMRRAGLTGALVGPARASGP